MLKGPCSCSCHLKRYYDTSRNAAPDARYRSTMSNYSRSGHSSRDCATTWLLWKVEAEQGWLALLNLGCVLQLQALDGNKST